MAKKPYVIAFDVSIPQELHAGISGHYDTITITVASGDPGGEAAGEDSFVCHMMRAIREWYDGGKVERTR